MNSCFYECDVFHRRLRPKPYEFLNRVFYFYLDLEELESCSRILKIFGVNRASIYSLRDEDHFQYAGDGSGAPANTGDQPQSIASNVREFLARSGSPLDEDGSIRMLFFPRIVGYVFNPITIYYCFRSDGAPHASVVEVGNTFRELKPFLVPRTGGATDFEARIPKHYYVSPFSPADLTFHFRFRLPGEQLSVLIDDYDAEGKVLMSALTGKRAALTFGNLLRFTAKFPFLTLRVISLIHWHAFRLWLKRVPFYWKETAVENQRGVFRPHRSLRARR